MESWEGFLRKAWLYHCQGEGRFPRDMLFLDSESVGKRSPVSDFDTLCRKTLAVFGKKSTYVSVYSFFQIEEKYFDRIFIDLDVAESEEKLPHEEKLAKALNEVRRINDFVSCSAYFSGKNGFAVYIYFDPIVLENPKESIRIFVEDMESALNLEYIDYHVIGDVSRVSRLPYTVNMKKDDDGVVRGKMCYPISLDWDMDFILKQSKKITEKLPVTYEREPFVSARLLEIDRSIPPEEEYHGPRYGFTTQEWEEEIEAFLVHSQKYYDKMGEIEDNPNKRWDGRHRLSYLYLIPRGVFAGLSDSDILDLGKRFIRDTGMKWKNYKDHYIASLSRTRERLEKGLPVMYRIDSILIAYPDLVPFFKELGEKIE